MSASTAPSLAEATAELRDATTALNLALEDWWRNEAADVSAASERWWLARQEFSRAITEPAEGQRTSYFTRDAIEEIREAGRGHLIPDYDPDWYEQEETTDEDREFFAQEDDSDRRFKQGEYDDA